MCRGVVDLRRPRALDEMLLYPTGAPPPRSPCAGCDAISRLRPWIVMSTREAAPRLLVEAFPELADRPLAIGPVWAGSDADFASDIPLRRHDRRLPDRPHGVSPHRARPPAASLPSGRGGGSVGQRDEARHPRALPRPPAQCPPAAPRPAARAARSDRAASGGGAQSRADQDVSAGVWSTCGGSATATHPDPPSP